MSAAQETYRGTVATANATRANSVAAAVTKHQTTIDASASVVGYNLQTGNYANYLAAVRSANAQKLADLTAAETAKQAAITHARDALRNSSGEYGY